MTQPNTKIQAASRRNHYVPVWYQTGFQAGVADNWLLDISAPRLRPDGTPIVVAPRRRPPKSSFWENELYVTRFGEVINDEVETILFREIDNFGADAIRAFVEGDERAMHFQLEPMLSYLGAQKLRTPKGLAWIRSRYPALSQVELLIELQHLRNMFGTLWVESVREIVSAESSEVKFLVSDHPVTMFNSALPEHAAQFADPQDPPLTWNGTQTLFALDANHLLILTHVPYAKAPDQVDAAARRVNARYFGNALMRTDTLIRSRRFTSDQVIAINGWLKTRARRYIAAAASDWLYPERDGWPDRKALAQLLLPPSDGLWHYGGEIYIGYNDGTYGYSDQYGRTSKEHEVVAKQLPAEPPNCEDTCPCGSGNAYGVCCEPMPRWERAPWDILSLRERNLRFINALFNVLGLAEDVPWTHVQRELSDEQVSRVHRLSQWLWPPDTDMAALLPKRDDKIVRALYMGLSDPRTLGENVAALAPAFDQIMVMDPFMFARNVRPEFSPIENPAQHKQQFLKNALFWIALAPLVEAGKVLVFPDPGNVNPEMHRAVFQMAQSRTAEWNMEPAEYEEMEWLGREDTERAMKRMPDEYWLRQIKETNPGISDQEAGNTVSYMRNTLEMDPLALLQPVGGEQSSQYLVMRGVNLEIALFVAQLTDAVIFTDISASWRQLHLHTRARRIEDGSNSVAPLRFTACLHPSIAVDISRLPESDRLRAAIKHLKFVIDQRSDNDTILGAFNAVQKRLSELSTVIESMPNAEPRAQLLLAPSIPVAGFESPTAQRLVVSFGSEDAPVKLGLAFFRRIESGHSARPQTARTGRSA